MNAPISKPCAWCQREAGFAPKADESHGICERHRRALELELRNSEEALTEQRQRWEQRQAMSWQERLDNGR